MEAKAIWVVVTPNGYVSDTAAFNKDQAIHRYLMQWLPEGVKPTGYTLDQLWSAFENAGYSANLIPLPPDIEGRGVCLT